MSRQFNEVYFESGRYLLDCAEWVEIQGFPGYGVCREGYVRHFDKILKPHKGDVQGHLNVRLRRDGKTTECYIHRLVAEAFIPNPNHLPYVRHLDDDRDNNAVENLAWGTQKDNHRNAVRNGTSYAFSDEDREKSYAKSRTAIICYFPDGSKQRYRGQGEVARVLGIPQGNIWKVLNGERPAAKGCYFEYASVEEGEEDD